MQIFFRYLRIASIALLGALLIPVNPAHAQERGSLIPNLFVRTIHITAQSAQAINGTFTIISKAGHDVSGVGYSVMIMSTLPEFPEGELFADNPIIYNKTYIPSGLTIAAGQAQEIPFYYSFDALPEGSYRIRIQLATDNGRNMGWWDEVITIESSEVSSFVELQPTAVVADSIQPLIASTSEGRRSNWAPLEGVNVNPKSEIRLQMNATNAASSAFSGILKAISQQALTTTPEQTQTELGALTLARGESRQLTVPFTAPEKPGAYHIVVSAQTTDGTNVSSLGEYRIVVRGASASVISVIPNTISFKKGETTTLTANIVGPADVETKLEGNVEIALLNGEEVVGTQTSPAMLSYEPVSIDASIELQSDITKTPGARITISDNSGNVLELYEVQFGAEQASASPASFASAIEKKSKSLITVIALLVIAAILGKLFWARRNKPGTPITPSLFILPLALGILSLTAIHTAHADHEPKTTSGIPLVGIGNSLIFGDNKFGVISSRGLSTFINSPIHEDMVEPGKIVPYQATASFYACGNDYYYNKWSVQVASNGGKVSSHSDSSWTNALTFPEDLITNSKTTLIRNVAGNITIPNIAGAKDTTIWSDVSWRKDDPGKEWIPSSVLTWLNVESPETDLSIVKSSPETIGQDEDVVYTLTVKNNGDVDAKNVIVKDNVPTGLGWDASRSSSGCLLEGNTVTCTIPVVPARSTTAINLTFIQGTVTATTSTPPSATPTPAPSVTPTYTFTYQQHPILFINSLGIYPRIYADSLRASTANAQKLCSLAGYATVVPGYRVRDYSSPKNNTIATWDEGQQIFTTQNAKEAGNPGQFDRLTCKDPITTGNPEEPVDPSNPTITYSPLACGTTVTNTATVSSDNGDPAAANNSSTITTTVTCPPTPPPDNAITITLLLNGSAKPVGIIPVNTTATLSWASTNADSCKALRNWSGTKAISGSEPVTLTLPETEYSYRLNCYNSATGEMAHKIVYVTTGPAPVQIFQCSDGVDNADSEDSLADAADPGCHTDGNANNPASYNASDDDETNSSTPGHTFQCKDGVDNADTEDTLADAADPGCHTDGNANNIASYNPSDDDETNSSNDDGDGGNNDGGNNGGGNNGGDNNNGDGDNGDGPGGVVETR